MVAFLDPAYVSTMRHDGHAVPLLGSGAWVNVDPIGGSQDARHVYPGLFCRDWTKIVADLEQLQVVSFVGVVFPIGVSEPDLAELFPVIRVIKSQYVVDPGWARPSKHHRKAVERARRQVEVELVLDPLSEADVVVWLYDCLRVRHQVAGTEAYPPASLYGQLALPSARLFLARVGDKAVAMQLWFEGAGWAHYAVGAADDDGYRTEASYALTAAALDWFDEASVDLGRTPNGADGLASYKMGWGAMPRPVFLCGRVFDERQYERLVDRHGRHDWFPAYRGVQDGLIGSRR